jgi:hypothetical protein
LNIISPLKGFILTGRGAISWAKEGYTCLYINGDSFVGAIVSCGHRTRIFAAHSKVVHQIKNWGMELVDQFGS